MKDRFLYNPQKDTVNDSLQEIDLTNKEINDLLNDFNEDNFNLESDVRYYRALYDMYERNYLELKKGVESLIHKYNDLSISKDTDGNVYSDFVEGLEELFRIE